MKYRFLLFFLPFSLAFTSCLTYYQKNLDFENKFESGQMQAAEKLLAAIKDKHFHKTLILQKMNQGVVAYMLGKYQESNQFFEDAYLIGEDYQKNYANEAASFLLNPNIVVYKPESHELMLIHYYKAMNYLQMGQNDDALVEARRMNIKLQQMNDKDTSLNKLKDDAFAHNLMGIIYQATGDYNNAFIAYRNAYNIYQGDYSKFFQLSAPKQLINDLLYTAYMTGLNDEVDFYQKQTGITFTPSNNKGNGDAVLFWNDGLGPVKDQWSINFVLVRGSGGVLNFTNEEYGLSFPFFISDNEYQSQGLGDLHVYRVVFPKYVERPLVFTSATLSVGNTTATMEVAQDVNKVAFKSLKDRMLTEMGKELLRFAIKKALEAKIRKENPNLGALVGVFDALSENADTRNWQTLPHSIYYTRVSLPEGSQNATLQMNGANGNQTANLTFNIKAGTTSFYNYNSLEYLKGPY